MQKMGSLMKKENWITNEQKKENGIINKQRIIRKWDH